MTEKELYLGIGLPLLAVLTSLFISLVQVTGIREDMRQMRAEFHTDTSELHRDLTTGLAEIRKEGREDRLRAADQIQLLTGKVIEMMGQK